MDRIWLRVALFAAPPVLLWLWLLTPALQPMPQRVEGVMQRTEACLGYCRPVLSVGGVALSCKADLLGLPYGCAPRILEPGSGSATYFKLPTVSGLLGLAPTAGVLLKLERDGEVIFRRSVRSQVLAGVYGGWGFHAVYWPIVGLIIWRWPYSRISRRAQWLPSKE